MYCYFSDISMYLVTTPLNTLHFRLPFSSVQTRGGHFPLIAADGVFFFSLSFMLNLQFQIMQRKHSDGTNKCFVLLHCAFYMC